VSAISRRAWERFLPGAPAAAPARPRPVHDVDERVVSLLSPMSFEAEQYRTLCHALERKQGKAAMGILGVSGPSVGDGKTTTALNLAGTLAQDPASRVLIVDADLRRPSVATRLGFDDGNLPGLAELIVDQDLAVSEVVLRRSPWNLFVLAAGRRPADPYRTLCSPRLGEILAEARQRFDRIVLDSPPLLAVPDAHVISGWVDSFLLVVGAHRTPRKLLEELSGPLPLALLGPIAGLQQPNALSLGLDWEARNDWLTIGHSQVRIYRLQARLLDRYQAVVIVSRVGEIMRVELPNGLLLVNEALTNL